MRNFLFIVFRLNLLTIKDWVQISSQTFQFQNFETEIISKMKKDGWDGDENMEKIQWTFPGALFYSIIVITTIGKFF